MSVFVIGVVAVVITLLLAIAVAAYLVFYDAPEPLEQLGVRPTYPRSTLPDAKIEAYSELKEKLRNEFAKDSDSDDTWMSQLPPQAKEMLKYRLMQRAVGGMAAMQKTDADARGYWRLFLKGMVTSKFWNSVVEAERDLNIEIENVKAEAASVEPTQDPQGIINDAIQIVLHGSRLPSLDPAGGGDAVGDLMKHLPAPGMPPPGMPPGMPAGMPGMPGMPPMHQVVQPAPQPADAEHIYNWRQDVDEVEVSVNVPGNAGKSDVKVVIQSRSLRVEHCGSVLVEGQLAAVCCPEGSTWTLGRGRIVVSLEKANPKPWPSVFAPKA